ncbi:putative Protein kinase byr2 [Hypsibius exemplaris]|uniref:Protein kinase domain-containing protein n=1 Tax=Hypsibius exemplaris TaxID=2072580 RepID=A0A1W0X9F0_HYPEX|nr:putative Protein kinase byr2 [Hypsibius exemplaris]
MDEEFLPIRHGKPLPGVLYKKGARIGKGTFGEVHLIEFQEPRGWTTRAMKTLSERVTGVTLEHEALLSFDHPNILATINVGLSSSQQVLLIHEYSQEGTLSNFLQTSSSNKITEALIRDFTKQLLYGLSYLHGRNIIHGDMKGANILLFDNESRVKIADLDGYIGKKGQHTVDHDVTKPHGTCAYMSPEMLKVGISSEAMELVGTKTDIWSLGCILLEMVGKGHFEIGSYPHTTDPDALRLFMVQQGGRPKIPEPLKYPSIDSSSETRDLREFLEECLYKDPGGRPEASTALRESPFINQHLNYQLTSGQPYLDVLIDLPGGLIDELLKEDSMEYTDANMAARLMIAENVPFPCEEYQTYKLTCPSTIQPGQPFTRGQQEIVTKYLTPAAYAVPRINHVPIQSTPMEDISSFFTRTLSNLTRNGLRTTMEGSVLNFKTGEDEMEVDLAQAALISVGLLFGSNRMLSEKVTQYFSRLICTPPQLADWMNNFCHASKGHPHFRARLRSTWEDIQEQLDRGRPVIALMQYSNYVLNEPAVAAGRSAGLNVPKTAPWLTYRIIRGYMHGRNNGLETVFYVDHSGCYFEMPFRKFLGEWDWKATDGLISDILDISDFHPRSFIASL